LELEKLKAYLYNKTESDKSFFFRMKFDEQGSLTGLFWQNEFQRKMMARFDDVSIIDTTAK